MKVLFLDIDGVLNSEQWECYAHYCYQYNMYDNICTSKEPRIAHIETKIDDRAIMAVNWIINNTQCDIVLSSSWRSTDQNEMNELSTALKNKGLIKDVFDITPRLIDEKYDGIRRGSEIQKWLNDNCLKYNIESYCIIDDCIHDMLEDQLNNIVTIDFRWGLTGIEVDMIIDILNNY